MTGVSSAGTPQPEQPPEFSRRIFFGAGQMLGLVVLLSVPLLALWGLLGDREEIIEARTDGLALRIEAPACARYGNPTQLRLAISGTAGPIRIELPTEWLARFSNVRVPQDLSELSERAYVLTQNLPPDGGVIGLSVEVTPERYGWARGTVRISAADGARLELPLKTFIFP